MWRDNQRHGYSSPILFPHSAKRVRDCRQNHHDCRQNIPWLLWNALLTTLYVSEHYKYMFLVARDLYEMFVLYRRKHTTQHSTVGMWSEVRVHRTPVHAHTVGRWPALGQVSRQPVLDVLYLAQARNSNNTGRFRESDHTIPEPSLLKHCVASSKSRTYLHQ